MAASALGLRRNRCQRTSTSGKFCSPSNFFASETGSQREFAETLGVLRGTGIAPDIAGTPRSRGADVEDNMLKKKETAVAPRATGRDPFAFMQQMTDEFERLFGGSFAGVRWPSSLTQAASEAKWRPSIDVFERDKQLVTKIDLPGMTKNDVKVEVADGYLSISGERKTEAEEKKEDFYRCEREYGSFYRALPLPDGIKGDDVKATFADGVLEITVPLPATAAAKPQQVEIKEAGTAAKSAA